MAPIGLEVAAFGAGGALDAVKFGATRIELNAAGSYHAGGLTPPLEDLVHLAHLSIHLRIMIRPRGPLVARDSFQPTSGSRATRDFIYSNDEFEYMLEAIYRVQASGLLRVERGDGFVFGILSEDKSAGTGSSATGTGNQLSSVQGVTVGSSLVHQTRTNIQVPKCKVDIQRCSRLVQAAYPYTAVFHRAFDEIVDCSGHSEGNPAWKQALNDLARCGFHGILTSGGSSLAAQNIDKLGMIIDAAGKLGIEVIVGGGVRKENATWLLQRLSLRERRESTWLHSSCLSGGATEQVNPDEVEGIVVRLREPLGFVEFTQVPEDRC